VRSVTIIGAGPAGLTAARVLVGAGLRDVLVLERNPEAGGLPRFCEHPGWGVLDMHRFWNGPRYARELVRRAGGAEILTNVTVTGLEAGGLVHVSTASGPEVIESRVVLLATGIREMPRGARLVSGTRPWGVTTTGAFQEMVQAGQIAFRRPVVIGSELVAFSALLTAWHAGVRPVAMIEPGERILAHRPGDLVARYGFGVKVRTGTRLVEIKGIERVEAVVLECGGQREMLDCDGVIFTGRFIPEAFLARAGGLGIDPGTGGPVIDNFFRCSDPAFFAAGNLLRPVEHSGVAAGEGARAAAAILRALRGGLPGPEAGLDVTVGGAMRYVYPQRIVPEGGVVRLYGRAARAHKGRLRVLADGEILSERRVAVLPERRLVVSIAAARLVGCKTLSVVLD
jgi:NADPH-dependent 2,4-dienoyl-CoA reductase/sulfur reductase-like enzyme